MNRWLFVGLAISGSFLLLQACTSNDTGNVSSTQKSERAEITRLKSELSQAQERIAQEEKTSKTIASKLESMQKKLVKAQERAEKAEAASGTVEALQGETEKSDMTRIGLMGAKALAEYRAKKLSERLDILKKDLGQKEKELKRITQEAQAKDREVAALSKRVEEFQKGQQARGAEIAQRLEAMKREIVERSAESKRLKSELENNAGLLQTLKNAAADSTKLKAEAEKKIAELQAQLTETQKGLQAQVAEAQKKTEAARNDERVARQETEQLKSTLESWRKEVQAINVESDRLRKDRDHFHTAAAEARVALERREAEAQQLRDLIAEMSSKLEACERSAQAAVQPPAPTSSQEKPSTIDQLLKPPGAEQARDHMTDLF